MVPSPVRGPVKGAIFSFRRMTSGMRLLPDFLVIGAARSGTTSLYRYLVDHPAIAAASRKEVQYFSLNHWRGIDWYRAHFPTPMKSRIVQQRTGVPMQTGEATPYYLFHPMAAERIADELPGVKLIVVLRNPTERAFSHYLHEVALGVEDLSFEQALDQESTRLEGEIERIRADARYPGFSYQHYAYLSRGHYHDQLMRWFSLLPRERFCILGSERFWADPLAGYAGVLRFLELPLEGLTEFPTHNKSAPSTMDTRTRDRLREYFAPHNQHLYELLNEDFEWEPG